MVFAVASDTRFLLGGELGVSEDEIADGFASFELVDLAAGTTVSEVLLDSGGRLPIAATGVLRAGVPYALTVAVFDLNRLYARRCRFPNLHAPHRLRDTPYASFGTFDDVAEQAAP